MTTTDGKQTSGGDPGIKQVNCPTCQAIVAWIPANKYRPFCSKKCQLIDFGDWASERYTIPVEEHDNLSFPGNDEDPKGIE